MNASGEQDEEGEALMDDWENEDLDELQSKLEEEKKQADQDELSKKKSTAKPMFSAAAMAAH